MASCGTVLTACIHQFCLRLCIRSGGETDLVACSVRGFIGWGKLKCQCMMDRGLNGQQNQTYPWKLTQLEGLTASRLVAFRRSGNWVGRLQLVRFRLRKFPKPCCTMEKYQEDLFKRRNLIEIVLHRNGTCLPFQTVSVELN
ncbi:hypothetical protein F2Q70_00016470 [Brassica cretica]|uniref:Uncharacterized protein n=1 Tax=Brassica cretica TaxID=69181 RepID=A0A8S9L2E3_BRACR|nr:hypothetical protein F2Q70_00016470 [Brassica cretica]KAF2599508.1 hypothetical protein F2Q68_00009434 [Brassica cretica]